MPKSIRYLVIFTIVVIIGVFLVFQLFPRNKAPQSESPKTITRSEFLDSIKDRVKVTENPMNLYLAESLKNKAIPTNRFYSSVTFSGKVEGLHTMPFAIRTQDDRVILNSPRKIVSKNAVTTQIDTNYISIKTETPIFKTYVENYSDLAVTLTFKDSVEKELFRLTAIQGSPYLFFKPLKENIIVEHKNLSIKQKGDVWAFEDKDRDYAVFTNGQVKNENDSLTVSFNDPNPYLTLGLYTDEKSFETISKFAKNTISSVQASYNLTDTDAVTEYEFSFETGVADKQTVFGFLPHHNQQTDNCEFTIDTIRGRQCFKVVGESVKTTAPRNPILDNLPWLETNKELTNLVVTQLEEDAKNIRTDISSSYFGGKNVARIARLIQIAEALDRSDIRDRLVNILSAEMANWLTYNGNETRKYFQYDSTLGGLIAQTPEFGSEEYNDHHFHYGYFLYTAGVLAQYNPDFVKEHGKMIDTILQDIANKDRNNPNFPYVRNFDFYEGHSWASGFGKFMDGNNQESTSEAINAWYGLWLWSKATNNQQLNTLATYLYNKEINSANYYWLNRSNNPTIFPEGYAYPIASLVWGGKFDFATFFSSYVSAIFGIQYLPYTAGSIYLYNPEFIKRDQVILDVDALRTETGPLLDYVAMYVGMLPEFRKDISAYRTMPLDNGNSRTNLYFWLLFWQNMSDAQKVRGTDFEGIVGRKNNQVSVIIESQKDQEVSLNVFDRTIKLSLKKGLNSQKIK